MQWYLMINHAKFSILHHAASHVDGSCSSGSCLVWIDAGIRRRHFPVDDVRGSHLAGIMIFDARWLQEIFVPEYSDLLQRLVEDGKKTAEQREC